ncbi:putative adipose-regulatory protein-domain-containing protein [Xylaria digitata]|nr:putative adipose-regulatory protein-domain-containing protein [Xylaria digitata]
MEYIKAPYHVATSPTAKKTYLGTVLFVWASMVLFGIASLAYPVFYYNYVPKKLITVPIHLQYNVGLNPYGIISLCPDLMLEQAYDVSIDLTLPRSPANLGRGNFMVALYALKSAPDNPAFVYSTFEDPYSHVTQDNVVFSSRRPALIPYEDPLVSMASRVLFLLYHILFAHTSETVTLSIPMGELVRFKGVLPLSVLVDVQAGQTLQVYSSTITLVARLTGMRWFMYNYRILSFMVCTMIFWLAEMISMGLAWVLLGWVFSGQGKDVMRLPKPENSDREIRHGGDEDDTEVKKEDNGPEIKEETPELKSESEPETLDRSPRHAGDADDEGGSEDVWEASGAGTSFHDTRSGGGQVRKRLSRGGST